MPAVDVAMERSLRRGFLDLFVASLRPALERRDIVGQISDVKTAFSSWDNCMQVAYCKWPVIALIIIGGLIIISVVWCIIRCACCGLSCCCSCFSCLKCCGDCCGCCDPPRGSRHKYLDEPYIPPNHGYKSQEPMHAGFAGPTAPAAAKGPAFAQFAEFDVGGKKNEDALPQMPSWEGAEHKKVLVEEDAVEMNALKKPEAGGQAAGAAAIGGAAGASSPVGPRSPVNRTPYGPPGGGPGSDGFFAASAIGNNDPYAHGAPGYNQPGMAYSELGQGYGVAARAMSPGPRSPRAYNNGGYNDGYNNGGYGQAHDYQDTGRQDGYDNYGTTQHQPYDNYDTYNSPANQGYGIARHQTPHEMDATHYRPDSRNSARRQGPYGAEARRSPAPQGQSAGGYGPESRRSPGPQAQYGAAYTAERRGSPAPQGDYARRSPAPQGDYNGGSAGYDSRPYGRAPPQRQYTSSPTHNNHSNTMQAPSPLRNDAGFDFTSGYSRPPPGGDAAGAGGYRQPSPPSTEEQGGAAYPGYKPYQRTA